MLTPENLRVGCLVKYVGVVGRPELGRSIHSMVRISELGIPLKVKEFKFRGEDNAHLNLLFSDGNCWDWLSREWEIHIPDGQLLIEEE